MAKFKSEKEKQEELINDFEEAITMLNNEDNERDFKNCEKYDELIEALEKSIKKLKEEAVEKELKN
jgi:uncharacterized LabA/DUF88 family protein